MTIPRRIPLVALIVFLVVALASPAQAETASQARRRREQTRAKKAELAKKIDALKASDQELERAVNALDAQVRTQQARTQAATQAVRAAEAQRAAAEAQLAKTRDEMSSTRSALVERAVQAYVRPQGNGTADPGIIMSGLDDLGTMSRRAALLNEVAGRDQDTLDRLNALQRDLGVEQDAAARARAVADQRKKLEEKSLAQLRLARATKEKLQVALERRIKESQEEADAVSKQEAALSSLIKSKEAPVRVSRGAVEPVVSGRVSGAGLIWPISAPVTSEFGPRWGRLHAGIDVGAGMGAPIRAAKSGTVIYSGVMGGYGNVVVIDHGGGFSTLYAHQSRTAANEGQSVSQGQLIGYVGNTGNSTGPHAHFETRVNGNPQNPRQYLP